MRSVSRPGAAGRVEHLSDDLAPTTIGSEAGVAPRGRAGMTTMPAPDRDDPYTAARVSGRADRTAVDGPQAVGQHADQQIVDQQTVGQQGGRPVVDQQVEQVSVRSLTTADSPRLSGVDDEHVRLLAQTDTPLPPILVHRHSMRILDGVHRLLAAALRGDSTIAVRFLEGSLDESFVLAVQANAQHGLPLSLADRKAAAARILDAFPTWSDRAVGQVAGLSAATVATLRIVEEASSAGRVGRDGRIRPSDMGHRRRLAGEMIARQPEASLRQIANACGISPMTARDVRARVVRGEDPVPKPQRVRKSDVVRSADLRPDEPLHNASTEPNQHPASGTEAILGSIRRDPSLRFTEHGRALLRWLTPRVSGPAGWARFARQVPPHARYAIAELARACAEEWQEFAERLETEAAANGSPAALRPENRSGPEKRVQPEERTHPEQRVHRAERVGRQESTRLEVRDHAQERVRPEDRNRPPEGARPEYQSQAEEQVRPEERSRAEGQGGRSKERGRPTAA